MKHIALVLIISYMKLASGYDHDSRCFDDNFANVTSSDDQGSPQIRLNLKHYHKSQRNFGTVQSELKSTSVALLDRGIKTVFEYR